MIGLTIGKVAKLSNVGVETIRYYQREGIVEEPPRVDGGFRTYPRETVQRIRFIKRAQDLGFSLGEISELLSMKAQKNGACGKLREKVDLKIEQVAKKISDLRKIRAALIAVKGVCANQTPSTDCQVLESFYS